ncbi:PAS domain S-box protein [Candidatus Sumerlaeota bacterium]|nr:PAS domain S-box protein [Candidatus Sumerlaeota bacterium]
MADTTKCAETDSGESRVSAAPLGRAGREEQEARDDRRRSWPGLLMKGVAAAFVAAGLSVLGLTHYLLFHTLIELFCVAVALAIFMIAWNARRMTDNDYLLFIGIAYGFVSVLDLFHTLAYEGMGVLAIDDANAPTQLWIAARAMQATVLLAAPAFLSRRLRIAVVVPALAVVAAGLLASVFREGLRLPLWWVFPVCYVEGRGLTAFKIAAEWAICAILLASLFLLYRRRERLDATSFRFIVFSILATIASEMAFTQYVSVHGPANLVGHLFKVLAFYFVYKALVETGLTQPYRTLFRDLSLAQKESAWLASFPMLNPRPIVEVDLDGGVSFANPAARRLFPDLEERAPDHPWLEDWEQIAHACREARPSLPAREVCVNGRWYRQALEYVADAQRVRIYAMDISGRRYVEEALRASETKHRRLFETARDGILILDGDTEAILDVNPSLARMLGYSHEYFLGKRLWELGAFKDMSASKALFEELQRSEHTRHEDLLLETADGKKMPVEFVGSVYRVNRQRIIQCNVRDIADRKKTEDVLRRSNENLEQFAYVASHDLQEPLRIMASFSQLLAKRYKAKLDSDADEFISYIVEAADRMESLISDLLAYSRVGMSDVATERIDCNVVLDRVLRIMTPTIERNEAVVTFDRLPSLRAHESDFVQLFQNLLGNAVKFRTDEPPHIHVGATRTGTEWLFCVADNGIGVERRYQDRIFAIFQRLHGRDRYPGTGIGLSICRRIVEAHGGRIWVDSEPGKGSKFYFTIAETANEEAEDD